MASKHEETGSCIYVGNLSDQTTQEEIDCLFWAFGELIDCRMGPHNTHAIVEFEEKSAADLAMSCLNGRHLHGCGIVMAFHENEQPTASKRIPPIEKKKIIVPVGKSPTNLYLSNLNKDVTEDDLQQLFSEVGTVETVRVFFGTISKEHLGTGCVRMGTKEEAQEAIDRFHETELEGQAMHVDRALLKDQKLNPRFNYPEDQTGLGKRPNSPYNRATKRPRSDTTNVFCKNLPKDYSEKELSELFTQHGEVESTRLFIGQMTQKPLGTACVRMREREAARAAIEALDKLNIDGHTISVEWALDKKQNRQDHLKSRRPVFEYHTNHYEPQVYRPRSSYKQTHTYYNHRSPPGRY